MEERLEVFYIENKLSHAYLPVNFAIENKIEGYIGPSNLKWVKKVDYSEPLEYLSPKSRKRILKAVEYATQTLSWKFEIMPDLTKDIFMEWLELYKKNISSKEVGLVRLTEDWYDQSPSINDYNCILVRNESGKLIGGALVSNKKSKGHMSVSYRAHEHVKVKDSSLASIIEFLIDKYSLECGYKEITRGTDTNLYGVRLSTGLNDFKVSYNFTPHALDYSSNYYKRCLVFFMEYKDVLTYVYSQNGEIEPLKIEITPTIDPIILLGK